MNLRLWIADCGFGERTCRVGVRRVRKLRLVASGRGIAPLRNAARTAQCVTSTKATKRRVDAPGGNQVGIGGKGFSILLGNLQGVGKGRKNSQQIPTKNGNGKCGFIGEMEGGWEFPGFSRYRPLRVRNSDPPSRGRYGGQAAECGLGDLLPEPVPGINQGRLTGGGL